MDQVQVQALRRASDALRIAMRPAPSNRESFSVQRLLIGLADQNYSGPDFGLLREAIGEDFIPTAPIIPMSVLTRDLTVGGNAGYLVETENQAPQSLLRTFSVVADAGVTIIDGVKGHQTFPIATVRPAITWVADESTQLSGVAATIGQVAATPKQAAALTVASGQLLRQSPYAEAFINQQLLEAAGLAVDTGVLNGSGGSGEPLGLLNTSGIGTQSGTSLALAGVVHMKKLVADSGARDAAISFIADTATRELLEQRERATGLGFIWDNGKVASQPAYATTTMPATTLVCGDFSRMAVVIWGIQLFADPFTEFRTGRVQFAVRVLMDTAVIQAGAFCAATSVT